MARTRTLDGVMVDLERAEKAIRKGKLATKELPGLIAEREKLSTPAAKQKRAEGLAKKLAELQAALLEAANDPDIDFSAEDIVSDETDPVAVIADDDDDDESNYDNGSLLD